MNPAIVYLVRLECFVARMVLSIPAEDVLLAFIALPRSLFRILLSIVVLVDISVSKDPLLRWAVLMDLIRTSFNSPLVRLVKQASFVIRMLHFLDYVLPVNTVQLEQHIL